jgi:hypothetical protein
VETGFRKDHAPIKKPGLLALVIEVACPAVCPSQDNREHPEGHDERCYKKHFSSRHDLLLLLLLPADILAESCSAALIGIKSRNLLTQVNLAQSTFSQTNSYRSGMTAQGNAYEATA